MFFRSILTSVRQSGALGGHSPALTLEIADSLGVRCAMVSRRFRRCVANGGFPVKTIFPIHDGFVFEDDECDAGRAAGVIREVMERVAELRVPLAVDVTIGRHWGEI